MMDERKSPETVDLASEAYVATLLKKVCCRASRTHPACATLWSPRSAGAACCSMAGAQRLSGSCCQAHFDVGKKVEFLLATGNLVSKSGLDLMQVRSVGSVY
jgi:hypothetical protein